MNIAGQERKVVSVTALHYGLEYLPWAVRSVIDAVDEMWMLYTPIGSHGHRVDRTCPEHAADLYAAALAACGDKLRWYADLWTHEGDQRDSIYRLCPDAEIVLTLDADEVWAEGAALAVLESLFEGEGAETYTVRMPLIHYWRSFGRAVVDDEAAPERVKIPFRARGWAEMTYEGKLIHHFGYAQSSRIVEYKQHVHGHKGEWRPDWWESRWLPNAQTDVHPTNLNYWNPAAVDPYALGLPAWMHEHPYASLEVIP